MPRWITAPENSNNHWNLLVRPNEKARLEIELAGTDKETARRQIDEACHKILSNPVIEDYRFEIEM